MQVGGWASKKEPRRLGRQRGSGRTHQADWSAFTFEARTGSMGQEPGPAPGPYTRGLGLKGPAPRRKLYTGPGEQPDVPASCRWSPGPGPGPGPPPDDSTAP